MKWTIPDNVAKTAANLGLVALYLIAAVSVVGFGVFRARPDLLATLPGAAAAYPSAIAILPRAQIIAAFAVLALYLSWRVGGKWIAAFVAVYLLSLISELAGTTLGIPFGAYAYTNALGAKWFGHVPLLIPFSWFMMALPSYVLAGREGDQSRWRRIAIGSLILLAWDLSLDPAMSAATAFWVWGDQGAYYGMPWLNLFGWYVTGLALMIALAWLGADRWLPRLSKRWLAAYYGANLALSLGIAAAAGMWLAFVATAVVVAVCWQATRPRAIDAQVLA
jgi:putative membrane protein